MAGKRIGHVELQPAQLAVRIDDTRPEHRGRIGLAHERIEVSRQHFRGHRLRQTAAGRRQCLDQVELGQNQVENLQRADLQRALGQEVVQGLRRGISRHLQDTLVDGEHRDTRRLRGAVTDLHRLARLHDVLGFQLDIDVTPAAIDGKWLNRVTERAMVNFRRSGVAHEGHVDVPRALEVMGNADGLHAALRIAAKPLEVVHTIALDGNQAGAGIRRANTQRNFFTGHVIALVQFQLQLGAAVDAPREVGVAHHRVFETRKPEAIRIRYFHREIARVVAIDGVLVPVSANGKRRARALDFPGHRLVLVGIVGLLYEGRYLLQLDQLQRQLRGGDSLQAVVDRNQLHAALAAGMNVTELTIGPVADQGCQRGNQRTVSRDHAAATGLVETLGDQVEPVAALAKRREIDIERGDTVGIAALLR